MPTRLVFPDLSELQQRNSDTIFVVLSKSPPFINQEKNGFNGLSVWLWEEVAKDLGINFVYQEAALHDLLSDLRTEAAHISINPLSISSERLERLHFGLPFYASNSAVLIHERNFVSRSWSAIKAIFSPDFLRVIGLLFCLLFIFGLLVWYFERRGNHDEFERSWKGILSGIWWSAVTMTTVGYGDKSPKTLGGRVVALIWMFTAVVTISGFTASIASSLTVNSIADNIESLDELQHVKMACIEGSLTELYLKEHRFDKLVRFETPDSAVAALNNREIEAFAYDEPILRYEMEAGDYRHVKMLPFKFGQQFYSFVFSDGLDEEMRTKIIRTTQKILESPGWEKELEVYKLKPF